MDEKISGQLDEPNQDSASFGRRSAAFGLRMLLRLLGCNSLRLNHFYGACLGRVLCLFDNRSKRIAQTNIAIAFPDLSPDQREMLVKNSLIELGKTITELGSIWTWSDQRFRTLITKVSGQQVVDDAQSAGKGIIILAPHFGAWELVGLQLSMNYQIVSLYRPPRLSTIEAFTRKVRERFGAKLVPTNISGVRALCRSLKQNNMVGILPDQDPGESGGIRAPFFGYSARTMLLVSKLAARTNSALVFCVAERLPSGQGYHVHYVAGASKIASTDELTAATALNEGVESIIQINPPQYQWSYKRFKGVRPGQPDLYEQPLPQLEQQLPQRRAA